MPFYLRLLLLTILLTAITALLQFTTSSLYINTFAYSSILFFSLITLTIYLTVQRNIAGNNHRQFSTAIMGGMTIKLFCSALFVLIYSLFKRPESIIIVVPFFIYYICFTILEVTEFMRLNKMFQNK
jgi:hypothetical protein